MAVSSAIPTEQLDAHVRYAAAATHVSDDQGCCDTGCRATIDNTMLDALYSLDETAELPEKAGLASQGCSNPAALIALQVGETVLDLGSGGGPTGFAYGSPRHHPIVCDKRGRYCTSL